VNAHTDVRWGKRRFKAFNVGRVLVLNTPPCRVVQDGDDLGADVIAADDVVGAQRVQNHAVAAQVEIESKTSKQFIIM